MTAFIKKASDDYWCKVKNFNTLQDLINFVEESHHDIIISTDVDFFYNIYDDDYLTQAFKEAELQNDREAAKYYETIMNNNFDCIVTIYDDYIE